MIIRHAVPEDLDEIYKLEQVGFPPAEAATYDMLKERLQVFPGRFWLLFDKDHLVSMISGITTDNDMLIDEMYPDCSFYNENGAWQMIYGVETHVEYRGKGCMRMVMERVIEDCRAEKRKGIVLSCKKEKIPMYEKFGFVCEGLSESRHGGAVWYDMRLTF